VDPELHHLGLAPPEIPLRIRLGYELVYQSAQPAPMILNLNVHYTRAADLVRADHMMTENWVPLRL